MAQAAKKRAEENERRGKQLPRIRCKRTCETAAPQPIKQSKVKQSKVHWEQKRSRSNRHIPSKRRKVSTRTPTRCAKLLQRNGPNKCSDCKDKSQNENTFQETYGEYIPQVPYTHGTINGEDMFKTVQQIRKTLPGLDGWRIRELKALGARRMAAKGKNS